MKIALLTIATGKYEIFVEDLVKSAEIFFLPEFSKEYFIFSDQKIKSPNGVDLNVIWQRHLGWPFDTMMRFHMFLSIKERLSEFDYVFFLNANMLFNKVVDRSILPDELDSYLVGVQHPGFYLTPINKFPYERNQSITCFIDYNDGMHYFQGCFNGGRSGEWIEMCEKIKKMIDDDLSRNLIPVWHDESYLNWYFKEKKAKVLPPTYGIPEQVIYGDFRDWDTGYKNLQNMEHYIIQRDKRKYGGTNFLRTMEIKDLTQTTFIIPVKIEHEDRYRNAKCVLNFLNRYFVTNVFIFEISETGKSKIDFIDNLNNLKIKHWVSPDTGHFHRTKYLNIMLDDVETPVVSNYDIDVLLSPETYTEVQEKILSGDAEVIYPYEYSMNGQYQVLNSFDYEGFFSSNFDYNFLSSGNNLNPYPAECGHCIFFKTQTYRELGGENEHFISYGPEDKERMERFKKILDQKVQWLPGRRVYHFEHYRSSDSTPQNRYFDINWRIHDHIKNMDRKQIISHYSSIDYRKNYKNFSFRNEIYEV